MPLQRTTDPFVEDATQKNWADGYIVFCQEIVPPPLLNDQINTFMIKLTTLTKANKLRLGPECKKNRK